MSILSQSVFWSIICLASTAIQVYFMPRSNYPLLVYLMRLISIFLAGFIWYFVVCTALGSVPSFFVTFIGYGFLRVSFDYFASPYYSRKFSISQLIQQFVINFGSALVLATPFLALFHNEFN